VDELTRAVMPFRAASALAVGVVLARRSGASRVATWMAQLNGRTCGGGHGGCAT